MMIWAVFYKCMDGLEGTVFKRQHGKGVTESEGETDEETDNEDDSVRYLLCTEKSKVSFS